MSQWWTVPNHKVRVSKRAKQVTIKISTHNGLEVVVPTGFDKSTIPEILRSKARWIEKNMIHMQPPENLERPDTIQLNLLSEFWHVEYDYSPSEKINVLEQDRTILLVTGPVNDPAAVASGLNQWMQKRAKRFLGTWLNRLSKELCLPFNRVSVRRQVTKWGSCSAERSISLNRNLLFVTPQLARYVLVHELCHCLRLDHSNKFWDLLEKYEPNARETAAKMRNGIDWIPLWAQI